jgi:hypothetical protein
MELQDIIAPSYRKSGLSCQNCTHLACEYDLDADRSGVWICEKLPGYSTFKTFPFQHQMPCFELSFWFSVFARNFGESTSAYEDALSEFTQSMARFSQPPPTHETVLPSKSSEYAQMG